MLGLSMLACTSLAAQPVLHSDESWRGTAWVRPADIARAGTPDTLQVSAAQPFFDDFAYDGAEPDSLRWFVPPRLIDVPHLTRGLAVDPPDWGAATFDGSRRDGEPYNPGNITNGTADRLFSHYLDLSGYDASSGLVLSFFLQPQGLGEKPESIDSFYVYFRTPNPPPADYERVLAIAGSSLKAFRQYLIPIDRPQFLHAGFQLRFESHGSQNGPLDLWHLDRVYLAPGRSLADSTSRDQAITGMKTSPLAPYTALPVQVFQEQTGAMQPFEVGVSNLAATTGARTLVATLSEPLRQTPLSPVFERQQALNLAPRIRSAAGFDAFGEQSLTGIAALEVTAYFDGGGDAHPGNDTLRTRYRIDSLLAYDDGEADAAFGLNKARGFGVRVDLPQPDSLTAIWICFQPEVIYNQVSGLITYMKGQSFRLAVWYAPHPDSLLLQQLGGISVQYGDAPNTYIRYRLTRPLAVPETFWVGVQQTNDLPLGVGYDFGSDRDAYCYWDSSGVWKTLRLGGALMIRPELYNTQPLPAAVQDRSDAATLLRVYPQPLYRGETAYVALPDRPGRYTARICDLAGRCCAQVQGDRPVVPATLAPGLYLWEHRWQSQGGDFIIQREKVLIR
ncbi:MAG: hypothetical protein OHK0039_20570 [Bacteroidia bacterium]